MNHQHEGAVDKTPPLPHEGRTTQLTINSRQTILSAIWVLSLQKLHFDTNVATIDTVEVKTLRIHIQEVPGGREKKEEAEKGK